MLKTVSSMFACAAALSAAMVVAEDKPQPSKTAPNTVTTRKPVVDPTEKMDVVDTAVKAGTFKTLAAAIKAAGLTETLKGQGPFTVFAPTDEAFAKLPKGALESLLRPENREKLKAILTYHVLPGNITAAQVAQMKAAETVNGQSLAIVKHTDHVMVNEAKITKTDIACGNGVIHVIDTVLMPKPSQK